MSTSSHTWEFVPHQHEGPQQQTGENDHIYSPTLHNGTLKSSGIATFMGAPYCPPDRHAIREMGAKICFLGYSLGSGPDGAFRHVVRSGGFA